jgi:hypothetical protein
MKGEREKKPPAGFGWKEREGCAAVAPGRDGSVIVRSIDRALPGAVEVEGGVL